jgi:hypothetical protein
MEILHDLFASSSFNTSPSSPFSALYSPIPRVTVWNKDTRFLFIFSPNLTENVPRVGFIVYVTNKTVVDMQSQDRRKGLVYVAIDGVVLDQTCNIFQTEASGSLLSRCIETGLDHLTLPGPVDCNSFKAAVVKKVIERLQKDLGVIRYAKTVALHGRFDENLKIRELIPALPGNRQHWDIAEATVARFWGDVFRIFEDHRLEKSKKGRGREGDEQEKGTSL